MRKHDSYLYWNGQRRRLITPVLRGWRAATIPLEPLVSGEEFILSTALKSCGHCGGAIITGVTGYGGQICMCPRPWTAEQKENLQTALQIIADRERLQIAEDILRRHPEGWLEYRNRTIPANALLRG